MVSVKLEVHLIKNCVWQRFATFFGSVTIFLLYLLFLASNPLMPLLIVMSFDVLYSLLLLHHLLVFYRIFSMEYKLWIFSRTPLLIDFNRPLELFKVSYFCLYYTPYISTNYRKYFVLSLLLMIFIRYNWSIWWVTCYMLAMLSLSLINNRWLILYKNMKIIALHLVIDRSLTNALSLMALSIHWFYTNYKVKSSLVNNPPCTLVSLSRLVDISVHMTSLLPMLRNHC